MSFPRVLRGSYRPRVRIVQELRVFAQPSPQSELLARIVALVDEVPFVRVGSVSLGEGLHGAVPCLLLEAVVVLEAHLDALAERPEEGGLVRRGPAEAWALAMGGRVLASIAGAIGLDGFRGAVVLAVGHCR